MEKQERCIMQAIQSMYQCLLAAHLSDSDMDVLPCCRSCTKRKGGRQTTCTRTNSYSHSHNIGPRSFAVHWYRSIRHSSGSAQCMHLVHAEDLLKLCTAVCSNMKERQSACVSFQRAYGTCLCLLVQLTGDTQKCAAYNTQVHTCCCILPQRQQAQVALRCGSVEVWQVTAV